MNSAPVRLVVALPAEAKPLRQHFALQRDQRAELPLYRHGNILLAVCGVGSAAAARAVHWLASHELKQTTQALWINVGIAGHPSRSVGEAVLASEIEDRASGRRWLTSPPAQPPCALDRLLSLQQPDPAYRWQGLQEMEAAGFYAAARDHAPAAAVQCLKVVSDNLRQPSRRINGSLVNDLIGGRLEILEHLIGQLQTQIQ